VTCATGALNQLDFLAWLGRRTEAEFNERMGDMRAPPAVVGQVKACAAAAPGAMADKAAGDIWWGVSTAISVAIGMTDATAALAKVVPECAAAAGAMRSLAAGSGST
jgi:hypothetical protein